MTSHINFPFFLVQYKTAIENNNLVKQTVVKLSNYIFIVHESSIQFPVTMPNICIFGGSEYILFGGPSID